MVVSLVCRRWESQRKKEWKYVNSKNLDELGCCWKIDLEHASACRRRKRGPLTRFTCQNEVRAARPRYIRWLDSH